MSFIHSTSNEFNDSNVNYKNYFNKYERVRAEGGAAPPPYKDNNDSSYNATSRAAPPPYEENDHDIEIKKLELERQILELDYKIKEMEIKKKVLELELDKLQEK